MNRKIVLDWKKYLDKAEETVAEGCVLLRNEAETLPLPFGARVSVFGRIQLHYYKSGTGSGGMVNVHSVTGILDALEQSDSVVINRNLLEIYKKWDSENPFFRSMQWGDEPWSQKEMPLSDDVVKSAADESDYAVVIIGRTAGEDKDSSNEKGSYLLTDTEEDMLAKVTKYFSRVVVLLNTGGIIDMKFVDRYRPSAVMYVWQGGMNGGCGVADLLTGKAVPSGKLTDTIAYNIEDYPSDRNFGGAERNFYCEDIYVGYRYFETFAPEKVMFPFGFGLSYTEFGIRPGHLPEKIPYVDGNGGNSRIEFSIDVMNRGKFPGKEVVQIYVQCPQGKLGKPVRSLCAFAKTAALEPGQSVSVPFSICAADFASYDDSGVSGHKSCFVLEAGEYVFFAGSDVRSAERIFSFVLPETSVVVELAEALAPNLEFSRLRPVIESGKFAEGTEPVPLCTFDMDRKRAMNIPAEIPFTGSRGILLRDVREGRNTMDEFIAQLSDEDLACIVRGEGMGSLKVTLGTAAAFGGVSDNLRKFGIPCGCCDDGPSGMRLDSGAKAFNMPNGTLMACTFNPALMTELFTFTGQEMVHNKIECLLGPGMNIHRHPLNGRNFEYFSEDPLVTGKIASGQLAGLEKSGVTGTIKHFCANNQETRRHFIDSVVSERALREIYLKGFEIAVKEGKATSVMTTYGALNGRWTAGSYDLSTTVLRGEWGFCGIVMTDWFASINELGKKQDRKNFAAMIRSQNDIYMVCPDGSYASTGDNTLEALADGRLARSELQRSAANICSFLMNSNAMDRLMGCADVVSVINMPSDESSDIKSDDLEIIRLKDKAVVRLSDKESKGGTDYAFAAEFERKGMYSVRLRGSSRASELAQIPCTLFVGGIPSLSFVFTGTGGNPVSIEREMPVQNDYAVLRLNVGADGAELEALEIEFLREFTEDDRKQFFWMS